MTSRHITKPRTVLSPAELAARDRRIARAIKSGVTITDTARRFRLSEETIRQVGAAMKVWPPLPGNRGQKKDG